MTAATPACTEEADGSLCMGLADNKGIVCTAIGVIKPDIDTDKDDQPFHSALGEVVGRSFALIRLGTHSLEFPLDQPYVR